MNERHRHAEFEAPPVVEVALGVVFEPAFLDLPKIIAFWHERLSGYPRFQIQPAIAEGPAILSSVPPIRCWFMDPSQVRLVQLQHDRLVFNWRKADSTTEYPHFSPVCEQLIATWESLLDFLGQQDMGAPKVKQCEVTYVDHLEAEPSADLASTSPLFEGAMRDFLGHSTLETYHTVYLLPAEQGELTLGLQPARRHFDGRLVNQLTTTVRSSPALAPVDDIRAALDLGHRWAVTAFLDFTSPQLQDSWRMRG